MKHQEIHIIWISYQAPGFELTTSEPTHATVLSSELPAHKAHLGKAKRT